MKLEKTGVVVLIRRCLSGAAGIARRQMRRYRKRSEIALRRDQGLRARNWLVTTDTASALAYGANAGRQTS